MHRVIRRTRMFVLRQKSAKKKINGFITYKRTDPFLLNEHNKQTIQSQKIKTIN